VQPETLSLSVMKQTLAVCRLEPDAPIPRWATEAAFLSVTRTVDELSVVVPEDCVAGDVQCERGWFALKVAGPLDFTLTGVLASLASPLAEAGISIFAISTFDTDYLMVKTADLEPALEALMRARHRVEF